MADVQLPVVFRMGGSKMALAVALGVALVVVGVAMIQKAPSAIAPVVGGALCVAGAGFSILSAIAWKRGLPTLELNDAGIVYSCNLQGVMRWRWDEIDSVDIETTNVPREMVRDSELKAVAMRLTNGKTVRLTAIADADHMRDAIAHALAGKRTERV